MPKDWTALPGRAQNTPSLPAGFMDELHRFPREMLARCLKFCQARPDIATGTKSTETT